MSQYSYVPGDSRLVDHIVGELKSKGIFDQFRKECISDVDTKPAYQNLRLRVEGSVSGFLSRQKWRPDLNKNQLREKLRKHIHEANYLEQGVERIVDQVVNPKVASVFIPQVEDLVYSYLGIQKPKSSTNTTNSEFDSAQDVKGTLPTDLDNVSLDSVKSPVEKMEVVEIKPDDPKMEVDQDSKTVKEETSVVEHIVQSKEETMTDVAQESNDSNKIEKKEYVNEEFIITTELSNLSMDIPLPADPPKVGVHEESIEFKQSDTETSLDSAIMRNVSPLTPVRSFNNENSCDAQPSFEERSIDNAEVGKQTENVIPISTFRFTIEKDCEQANSKPDKLTNIERPISYEYEQSDLNNYGAPAYDDSSSSNNLHIDYQSDKDATTVDSRTEHDVKPETAAMLSHDEQSKSKDNCEEKKKSHKSSHSSRDSHRNSTSKNSKVHRSDSKHHSSDKKASSGNDRKSSRDETSHSKSRHSSHRDRSRDRSDRDKKESSERKHKEKDSSKDRHSSSHKTSSSTKDSKSSKHHSSSLSHRHSSSNMKSSDEKKSSSSRSDEKKSSSNRSDDKKTDKDHNSSSKSSREHSRHSSSHRSDKDKYKSCSSKDKDKENKKEDKKDKKVTDDHYSASGRGNRTRRSTDRDSNDGNSSSSKGSTFMSGVKTSNTATDNKNKSENQSSGSDSTGPSDSIENVKCTGEKDNLMKEKIDTNKTLKPVLQLDSQLKTPVVGSPQISSAGNRLVKKPMIAANMTEAIKLMKVRKQLAADQEKKRQEAALLLEFQEKIHSSISQVYSGISGPELEFACIQKYPIEESGEKVEHIEFEVTKAIETPAEKAAPEVTLGDKPKTDSKDDNTITAENEESADDDYLNFVYGDLNKDPELRFFGEQETNLSKLEKDRFKEFYNTLEKVGNKKVFLLNCDFHHEYVLKQLYEEMGHLCDIVNMCQAKLPKGGPSKLNTQDLAKSEVILPVGTGQESNSIDDYSDLYVFSPNLSSDCSLDVNQDYEEKIDAMIQMKSRQEVMEIILGGTGIESSSNDYTPTTDTSTEDDVDDSKRKNLKRKLNGVVDAISSVNNNHKVLMPNKMRRLSLSEQITSTTESGDTTDNSSPNFKSKFIGKVRRVGLPRPKNTSIVISSPSSDKSVENYIQNSQTEKSPKLNGNIVSPKSVKKTKLTQRYDTSDLYKPKLHYMSKRHSHVT